MRVVLVGGFLGAGKTTTMLAAARLLEARGERVAVITNDQGTDLVDTRLAQLVGERECRVAEVTGGCLPRSDRHPQAPSVVVSSGKRLMRRGRDRPFCPACAHPALTPD